MILTVLFSIGETVVRSTPNPYKIKREAIRRYGKETETVILGDSHPFFGIIADSLPRTLNLAMSSQTLEYDYLVLKRHVDSLPHLKRILLGLDVRNLHDTPFKRGKSPEETYYRIYLGIDKYPEWAPENMELFQFTSYKRKFRHALAGGPFPLATEKGFALWDAAPRPDSLAFERLAPGRNASLNTKTAKDAETNIRDLDSILALCRKRGIEVVALAVPVTPAYTRNLAPGLQPHTDSVVRSRNIPYHDFSRDSRFHTDDFFDSDHLNDAGALKFTRILRDSIYQNSIY